MIGGGRKPRHQGAEASDKTRRPLRASAERLFELARHLTERDREVALCLFQHRLLTTAQLELLFFSSRRRAQDRLLLLYRNRILDRFYPPAPFGSGKPEAHWLLDEAGALLVSAMLEVERKGLGWQRRDDWGSHPQLAHQLEVNRFVTDLIAATLTSVDTGIGAWWPPAEATRRLGHAGKVRVLPDAGLILATPAGAIECHLEWDRGTETQQRLTEKLIAYRRAEARLYAEAAERSVLFVVPGERRLQTLRRASEDAERRLRRTSLTDAGGSWPLVATTAVRLRAEGLLAAVWERLDVDDGRLLALPELPVRRNLPPAALSQTLGRRWRKDNPDFWRRLSPLGNHGPTSAEEAEPAAATAADRERDLRLSGIDGSIDDSDDEPEEERWL